MWFSLSPRGEVEQDANQHSKRKLAAVNRAGRGGKGNSGTVSGTVEKKVFGAGNKRGFGLGRSELRGRATGREKKGT